MTIVFQILGFFFAISILTADFFDPTFFHQLSSSVGIQNWLGVMGALIGGTVIEIFGPVSLVFPWLLLRCSFHSFNQEICKLWFYSFLMIVMGSTLHAMLWKTPLSVAEEWFFLQTGYLGTLTAMWIEQLGPLHSTLPFVLLTIVFCIFKTYQDSPLRIFVYLILFFISLPNLFKHCSLLLVQGLRLISNSLFGKSSKHRSPLIANQHPSVWQRLKKFLQKQEETTPSSNSMNEESPNQASSLSQ